MSTRDIFRKLMYADDLAVLVVADCEAGLQERLVEWKEIFDRHGLRVSLKKIEVLWVTRKRSIYKTGSEETEPAQQLWVEQFAEKTARRQKFAGQYKLGRVHGGNKG